MDSYKVYVVFSQEGVEAVLNGSVMEIKELFDSYPDELEDYVKIREFETEEERCAYLKALDDFDGLVDFITLDPKLFFDQEIINEIENQYA